MTLKLDRKYLEEHEDELAKQFEEECISTPEDHEELCKQIRSGEIEGIIYPDGSTWTPK